VTKRKRKPRRKGISRLVHNRPAEIAAGGVGTVVTFILAILKVQFGFELHEELQPYLPFVVGWIAAGVTWLKLRSAQ